MIIYDLIIIGAGASGCMAAIQAARRGASVLLLDNNEKIGKKIYITGKGRCNLTNNSDIQTHHSKNSSPTTHLSASYKSC